MITILTGDCRDVLPTIHPESIHSIVTDPPYGLSFMGKGWDHGVPGTEFWAEALRVLKPGGYLLAFGGTRTFHRLAVAIEDAGFEIRDTLSWLYGSGFPKSLDVSKAIDKAAGAEREVVGYDESKARPNKENFAKRNDRQPTSGAVEGWKDNGATITAPATDAARDWQGWGTALKPGWEPIIMARKPFRGTVAANVLEHGTGAINVNGCRISSGDQPKPTTAPGWDSINRRNAEGGYRPDSYTQGDALYEPNIAGRWPANVLLDEDAAAMLDEQSGITSVTGKRRQHSQERNVPGTAWGNTNHKSTEYPGDTGGASRFFYCAKASRSERGEGNTHPTVKPVALMRWLVRMVTPPGGTVLDPFMGSGTTGIAASLEGFDFIGVERDEGYVEIARNRLASLGQ